MHRFMDLVSEYKECVPVHPQLWGEFRDMLNEEFGSHAWKTGGRVLRFRSADRERVQLRDAFLSSGRDLRV